MNNYLNNIYFMSFSLCLYKELISYDVRYYRKVIKEH